MGCWARGVRHDHSGSSGEGGWQKPSDIVLQQLGACGGSLSLSHQGTLLFRVTWTAVALGRSEHG